LFETPVTVGSKTFWPLIRLTRVNGSSRQMGEPTGRDFPFSLW